MGASTKLTSVSGDITILGTSVVRAVDRRLKNCDFFGFFLKSQFFVCIVQENYTEVVSEHLSRLNTRVDFFVNKYFNSGVLTYLWERELLPKT